MWWNNNNYYLLIILQWITVMVTILNFTFNLNFKIDDICLTFILFKIDFSYSDNKYTMQRLFVINKQN